MTRSTTSLTRRALLAAGGGVALAFRFGCAWAGPEADAKPHLPGSLDANRRLDAWFRIDGQGRVTLFTGKVELGQGVLTALGQIAAEELDVPIERVGIVSGDTALSPDEGVTAGSFSMPHSGTAVRYAAAEVRHIMLELAAARLKAPVESLRATDGTIYAPGGSSATYGELAGGQALAREATGSIAPKAVGQRRYIGRSAPRRDLPAKILGRPAYVQDFRPADMVHGRVLRPPSYGATLASADLDGIRRLPGVLAVVRDGSFLGVIATREDQALAAVEALEQSARWTEPTPTALTQAAIHDWLKAQKSQDVVIRDAAAPTTTPARTLEAVYRRPYLMHGSIGPSAAVGLFADGTYLIQTHSQGVFDTAQAIAEMLGEPRAKVRLQHMQGSGCYGHNGADDVAADAALLARAWPGVPVRVQWRRKDEHRWEPYGSAMQMEVKAGLDAKGDIVSWTYDLWSTPHSTRPGGKAGNLLAARSLGRPFVQPEPRMIPGPNYGPDRNAIALYDLPSQKVTTHFVTEMPVRVSSLRSLGAYANVFAIESFMDELARSGGADPLAYRLRHLKDPRAAAVLNAAAEAFGWSRFANTEGHGRGVGFARYKNLATYCAVCLEVQVERSTGAIRVVRATVAADAGELVNPDGVSNQIEGGVIQSLSWSLKEEVRFENGRILSDSWATYPILRFSEVPPIQVVLIDRPGEPFLGAGEASQGPTAAALANAVFDAADLRLRALPFTPDRVKGAIA